MATPGEIYRDHRVWSTLALKREALETSRFSSEELEQERAALIAVVKTAERSRANPQPFLYDAVLDELSSWINGLASDEASVQNHLYRNGGIEGLASIVRRLPGPPPRNLPGTYLVTLDASINARMETLAELGERITEMHASLDEMKKSLLQIELAANTAAEESTTSADQAKASATALEEELKRSWKTSLEGWEETRREANRRTAKTASEHLGVLALGAQLGDRLLEHTTATLVAKDWGQRASRERRAGFWMRLLGIAILACAALVGVWIVSRALKDGFDLTLGDGILRASLVAAIAGLGAAVLVESRRHYRESDSSEEIGLALTALEPYFAGDPEQRATARKALGEAVFVANVLSRFAHRDAAKHGDVSSLSISTVTDAVSQAADTIKNVRQAGS